MIEATFLRHGRPSDDGQRHDRAAFSCGKNSLDWYLKNQAGQAVGKNLAAAFVPTPDGKRIAGYYTLSSYAVKLGEIPEEIAKKLTRINSVWFRRPWLLCGGVSLIFH